MVFQKEWNNVSSKLVLLLSLTLLKKAPILKETKDRIKYPRDRIISFSNYSCRLSCIILRNGVLFRYDKVEKRSAGYKKQIKNFAVT